MFRSLLIREEVINLCAMNYLCKYDTMNFARELSQRTPSRVRIRTVLLIRKAALAVSAASNVTWLPTTRPKYQSFIDIMAS